MTIGWGILGTGTVAGLFTEDLLAANHRVVAVGSRAQHTADAFAYRYGVGRAYGTYAELASDERIDVVYVATPHDSHFEAARLCLEAGRAVLVEKPFTTGAAQAEELAKLARCQSLFAMEAMWTRFNPLIVGLRELVAADVIGAITAISADFSVAMDFDPAHRLWAAERGGGALLDLGVYLVSFASMLLGTPNTVEAVATKARTGVDANTGLLLGYDSGAVGLLHCGLLAESGQTATVVGTAGRIEVASPFFRPTMFTLHRPGAEPEIHRNDVLGHGYTYQADEVARCVEAGLTESPAMPLDESVAILATLDEIARRLGR